MRKALQISCIVLFLICSSSGDTQKEKKKVLNILDSSKYLLLEELYDYYEKLVQLAPDSMHLKSLGDTFIEGKSESNQIYLVSIGNEKNPILFFDCGIHAREWISPATCAYIIQKLVLVFEYNKKKPIKSDILKFNWQFIPMLNPDGYQLTQKNRMHRKNARPVTAMNLSQEAKDICKEVCENDPDICLGVDLNRNFPSGWGLGHEAFVNESKLYCTNVYKGPEPLSEPETKILHKHVTEIRNQTLSAISMHSYSAAVYYPKGWLLDDDPEQITGDPRKLLHDFADYFNQELGYQIGNVATVMSPTDLSGGATDDYYGTYQKFNICYTIELDPDYESTSGNGFTLPAHKIQPVGKKMWKAYQRMAQKMAEMYHL